MKPDHLLLKLPRPLLIPHCENDMLRCVLIDALQLMGLIENDQDSMPFCVVTFYRRNPSVHFRIHETTGTRFHAAR